MSLSVTLELHSKFIAKMVLLSLLRLTWPIRVRELCFILLQLTWVDYCSYFWNLKALAVFCEIVLAIKFVLFGGLMCCLVDAWLMIPPILCGRHSLSPPLCDYWPPLPLFVMLDTDMINLRKCHWPTYCERRCSRSRGNMRVSVTEERVGKKWRGKIENE